MLRATNVEDDRQNDARHRVPLKRPLPPLIPGSAQYPGLGRIGGRPLWPRRFSEDVGREERDWGDGRDRPIKATSRRGEGLSYCLCGGELLI
jgi:hypothetical protein